MFVVNAIILSFYGNIHKFLYSTLKAGCPADQSQKTSRLPWRRRSSIIHFLNSKLVTVLSRSSVSRRHILIFQTSPQSSHFISRYPPPPPFYPATPTPPPKTTPFPKNLLPSLFLPFLHLLFRLPPLLRARACVTGFKNTGY